jgi:hypothetical protein
MAMKKISAKLATFLIVMALFNPAIPSFGLILLLPMTPGPRERENSTGETGRGDRSRTEVICFFIN